MKSILIPTILLASGAVARPTNHLEHPVCIVGAGPAGLTAAHTLESKGLSAVVFEKQALVGGKCQAYYEPDGTYHPLGALLFSNATYELALPVIENSGVIATPMTLLRGQGSDYIYDWKSGDVSESPKAPVAFINLMKEEVVRYSGIWKSRFEALRKRGYDNGIPDEFTVSTQQWLQDNGFKTLQSIFVRGMVVYGYGDLRQIPIVYMLQYFTPDVLGFFIGQHEAYLVDFHGVWTGFAKSSVKSPILLNTKISKIDRSSSTPTITYTTGTSKAQRTKRQVCSKIIIAFPPTVQNLVNANLDVTESERKLFSDVKVEDYYAAALNVNTPPSAVFSASGRDGSTALPPDAAGEPIFVIRLHGEKSSVAAVYSWDNSTSPRLSSIEEGKQLMMSTISHFNKDPKSDAPAKLLVDADVRAWKKWDYFPHVEEAALKAGWYEKFAKAQGNKNTFYASGLNGFENVEFALRAGKEIVEKHF